MPDTVEIGMGRSARRGYHLSEVALVPTRRTRGSSVVSTDWRIDAISCALPLVTAPSDAVVSPATAAEIDRLGGLAVLDGEGLWTRYEDAAAELAALDGSTAKVQAAYAAPVSPELLRARVRELRAAGGKVAVRLSPQHTAALAPHVLAEGIDLLVIYGTITSAEHVTANGGTPNGSDGNGANGGSNGGGENAGLNLKTFIADLDVPVIVGGATNYQTALHLMRTGAAGVIIGYGARAGSTTPRALGIEVPMATAIVDAAAARRDYLDETGGRYVHLIAYGDVASGGDIAKALACGADAVMLGEALAFAAGAPGQGRYWDHTASHPRLPRSFVTGLAYDAPDRPSLREVLTGPTADPSGQCNLFGALKRAMGKCGYSSLKEFQKAELIVTSALR